jgi:hypothetical protein
VELELRELIEGNPVTAGMTLRVHGRHFVLGRSDPCPDGPFPNLVPDERVRLTHLGGTKYGLSVLRHTGRWQKTPFSGSLAELLDTLAGPMQHLVVGW